MPMGWAKRRTTSKGRLNPLVGYLGDLLPRPPLVLLAVLLGRCPCSGGSRGTTRSAERPPPERRPRRWRLGLLRCPRTCWNAARLTTSQTFSKYSGRPSLAALGRLHHAVAAEDFERRPDAGEHQIRASNTLVLGAAPSSGQRALGSSLQDIGPVADWAHHRDADGRSGGRWWPGLRNRELGGERPCSVAIGQDPVMVQPPRDHAG